MLSLSRTRISLAVLIGFVSILVISLIPPAHAGTRAAARANAPQMTEDNDTNDGGTRNNVVDDNDNAHPSGKDRSVENGRSGNQGRSKANPDNNGSGPERFVGRGHDKPNGNGGADKADQDGNNGCGNDDDFEDDNEGHCGRPSAGGTTPPAKPSKPSKPGKPGKPAKPAKPAKPSKPGKPSTGGENPGNPGKPAKVGVCHRTGSMTNPYVHIVISEQGAAAHERHEGDVIGAASLASCPRGTDPVDPEDPTDPGEVGGEIDERDPRDEDPIVIIRTPSRRTTTAVNPPAPVSRPGRHLAATGITAGSMTWFAALSLLLGAGLLGIRRYARSS